MPKTSAQLSPAELFAVRDTATGPMEWRDTGVSFAAYSGKRKLFSAFVACAFRDLWEEAVELRSKLKEEACRKS